MNRLARRLIRRRLIRAAKRGHFDGRMFDYYGVPHAVNIACRRAVVRAYAHGLVPTATTNGVHSPTSFHTPVDGIGRAVDLGNIEGYRPGERKWKTGRARLVAFQQAEHAAFHRGERPRMLELIGPDNRLVVLRAHETDLVEGTPLETQHDTHVHVAFR